MTLKSVLRFFWLNRDLMIIFLVPILLLPLPVIADSKEMKCAYAILIMAIYWITEALPLSVTALLPVILFPMLEVIPPKRISKYYVNDTTMLFMGGLLIGIAIEKWNLHRRIALRVLMVFGSEPRWLILGLMLNTWFLSMWISNTATTAMMMPIAEAVLQQMKKEKTQEISGPDNLIVEMEDIGEKPNNEISDEQNPSNQSEIPESNPQSEGTSLEEEPQQEKHYSSPQPADASLEEEPHEEKHYSRLCKAVSLSIAYAANIGGMGTLTGTPPNLVLKAQAELLFASHGLKDGVTFGRWMLFGVPLSLVLLFLTWIWLLGFFLRSSELAGCFRTNKTRQVDQKVKEVIRTEYKNLGPMSFSEIMVLIHFVALAILLITRDLHSTGGWGTLFRPKFVSDSTSAMFISLLLFIVPSARPKIKIGQKNDDTRLQIPAPLLTWSFVEKKLPWGIIILLGGGFALANAAKGYSVKLNPLYVMFPAALACSFAFMLPMATPPNAIVFTGGHLTVADMASAGFFVNIISVFILTLALNTWGDAIFDFQYIPPEFFGNSTTKSN